MDEKFQDRIDDYLFNRMDDAEKKMFLREVEQDADKKEQLEFTQNVKDSIRSREDKLQALAKFRQQYEEERKASAIQSTGTERTACYCPLPAATTEPGQSKKKMWLWISGVAAVLVAGFFAIGPMLEYESSPNYNSTPMEEMRGGDDVFSPAAADSTDNTDNDTIEFSIGKEMTPNE